MTFEMQMRIGRALYTKVVVARNYDEAVETLIEDYGPNIRIGSYKIHNSDNEECSCCHSCHYA